MKPRSTPTINAIIPKPEPPEVTVSPEEFRSRIFGKFAQATSDETRRVEGAGLGLNLSRQLVELMKGEIGFESKTGEGTTFFVRLPMATAQKEVA